MFAWIVTVACSLAAMALTLGLWLGWRRRKETPSSPFSSSSHLPWASEVAEVEEEQGEYRASLLVRRYMEKRRRLKEKESKALLRK